MTKLSEKLNGDVLNKKRKHGVTVTEAQILMQNLPKREPYKLYAVGGIIVIVIVLGVWALLGVL